MSFTIAPNTALGMGVILICYNTLHNGDRVEWQRIPCHNRATANHIAKSISNPKVADMAVSFANRSKNS